MAIRLSTPYYIGAFVILFIIILALILLSPTQNSFFDLQERYPILYYNLHKNDHVYKQVIKEIIAKTGINRVDMESTGASESKLEWIDYPAFDYVRGKVQILPLYYNGQTYNNCGHFPLLMQLLQIQSKILNVFFWKFSPNSALLQHAPKLTDGKQNIHEANIIDKPVLRYTLAVNVLSCAEEECSLWVGGQLKKLTFDKYLLWDPNKEFSLHNETDTDGDVIFLNIDLAQ